MKRPKVDSYEGKTPALSDAQVRALLEAPKGQTLKAKRDRAILSILFYHALRRDELCKLMVKDVHERRGTTDTALTTDGVYQLIKHYAQQVCISVQRFGPHSARATAATNALDQGADIAKVQEWLGHANVSTTRVYDHRKTKPEDSPTFKVRY